MKIIIMGCGRTGAQLAAQLDSEGHQVTILDVEPDSFRRLPSTFRGTALVGNGIDQDVLRRAGIEEADAFVSVTQGDNRNVMAAQVAKEVFHVPKAICRIYDPIREEMYKTLGLGTISVTKVAAQLIKDMIEG